MQVKGIKVSSNEGSLISQRKYACNKRLFFSLSIHLHLINDRCMSRFVLDFLFSAYLFNCFKASVQILVRLSRALKYLFGELNKFALNETTVQWGITSGVIEYTRRLGLPIKDHVASVLFIYQLHFNRAALCKQTINII